MHINSFRRTVFNAKYGIFRRQAPAYYKALIRHESLSSEELEELNWTRRLACLAHAYDKSPFYKQKYSEAGLNPNDIKTRDDWQRIPGLTRDELRQHLDDMLTVDRGSRFLRKATTGGTTGVPVSTYEDGRSPRETLGWRMMRWWGVDASDNGAFVWRMRTKPGLRTVLNQAAWWPTRKLRYDASSMTPAGIDGFLADFNRLKPPLLQGYTGALAHLAMHILNNAREVHHPKAIWVTSSVLGDIQRKQIEQAFHAPVYDQYGSCETRHISAQCGAKEALHIHYDSIHLDFVDDAWRSNPVGERGRILVTDLDNLVFPLIRYENGDEGRALPGRCPCGISLPLMDKVSGRVSDLIHLPGGGCLNGEYLTTIFDAYPEAVKQFQVRQAKDYAITVFYVPNPGYTGLPDVLQNVEQILRAKIGDDVLLTMKACDDISHDRGKLRFVISDVE
jgi:phenylacetate-coenzyme A ligase PaaK-like adenylate-forming protein